MKKSLKSLIALTMLAIVLMTGVVGAYDFEEKIGDIDLNGTTVKVVAHWDILNELENKHPGRIAEAEEKFNCKIEFEGVKADTIVEQQMNRLLAGESTHDIWLTSSEHIWHYIAQAAISPINDIVPEDYTKSLPPEHQGTINTLSYAGNKYGFSAYGSVFGAMRFVYFNKDMFEEAGLKNPYYYYQRGEWNWETAKELAKKLTKDTDGDGKYDQYGFGNIDIDDMIISNGARYFKKQDGKYVFALNEEESIKAIKEWYQWGNVDKIAEYGYEDSFNNGKYGMITKAQWQIKYDSPKWNFEYGAVPIPKGPDAERYQYPQNWFETLVLPTNAEDKLELIAVADYLWSTDDYDAQSLVTENAPDRASAMVYWKGLKTWNGDSNLLFSILPDEYDEAIEAIENGEKTPSAALDEIEGLAQQKVDDFFNQE